MGAARRLYTILIGSSTVDVRIVDKNDVIATKNGKTYSISVMVNLKGRDGVAKDTIVMIKVKVKR